jgi:hypothetical protein
MRTEKELFVTCAHKRQKHKVIKKEQVTPLHLVLLKVIFFEQGFKITSRKNNWFNFFSGANPSWWMLVKNMSSWFCGLKFHLFGTLAAELLVETYWWWCVMSAMLMVMMARLS